MVFINDEIVEIFACLECGWTGPEQNLHSVWNDRYGEKEIVCPYCENQESRREQEREQGSV